MSEKKLLARQFKLFYFTLNSRRPFNLQWLLDFRRRHGRINLWQYHNVNGKLVPFSVATIGDG